MYLAGRSNLKLLGKVYRLDDPVDVGELPTRKIGSLVRLGLLVPQMDTPVTKSAVAVAEKPVGDLCPVCGAGPFKNVAMHTSRIHKDEGE